jgi:hypothetical protein
MKTITGRFTTLLSLAVACSGDRVTEPGSSKAFNATGVSANVATIERVAAAPALESYRVLGRYIGVASQSPADSGAPALVAVTRRIAELTGVGSGAQLVPVVRPGVLGRTYVFSAAAGTYVHDGARTGAPANGVRFVLYETNAETGAINPAKEIGHADLIDERAGSPTSAGLRFRVVSGGVTALEYAFEISGLVVAPVLAVNGFMSDGTERVNFQLTVGGPAWGHGGTVTLAAKLELPSQNFSVETTLEAPAGHEGGPSNVVMTIRGGSDVIVVTSKAAAGQVDVTVTVNGKVLATATGDAAHPVLKGEGGRELTAEELAALGQIVAFANGVFKLLGDLLTPAGALLGLAIGLLP